AEPDRAAAGLPFSYTLSAREATLLAGASACRNATGRAAGRLSFLARRSERGRRRAARRERQHEAERAPCDLPREAGSADSEREPIAQPLMATRTATRPQRMRRMLIAAARALG